MAPENDKYNSAHKHVGKLGYSGTIHVAGIASDVAGGNDGGAGGVAWGGFIIL